MNPSIIALMDRMDPEARNACTTCMIKYEEILRLAPGSSHNHQAWPGGYLDHVKEAINIALKLYPVMEEIRPLPFSLSDALFVLFFHDIEKPWKYVLKEKFLNKTERHEFRKNIITELGYNLSEEQEQAIKYTEGELDYSPTERKMSPLAAFCHMCDVASARIWWDQPEHD